MRSGGRRWLLLVAALGALGASGLLGAIASDHAGRTPRATSGAHAAAAAPAPGVPLAPPGGAQARRPAQTGRSDLPPVSSRPIEHGPRTRRWVALTFDADMTRAMLAALRAGRVRAAYDERIVAQLRALRAPATVFLTGLWTETYPEVARSLAHDRRFELGNHTVDHSGFVAACYGLPGVSGEAAKRAEIGDAAATIARVTGVRARWFRFPGGCHSAADARLVAAAGEQPVQWDVASGDAYLRDPVAIVRQTLRDTRPGSIVVMHLNGAPNAPATSGALPAVVRGLRARGLRLVTLSQLLTAAR